MRQRLIAIGIIVVSGVIMLVVVSRSLPGDMMYIAKINVIERFVGLLQFSVKNHTRYELHMLEERLHETNMILQTHASSNKSLQELAVLIEKSTERILEGMREQAGVDDGEVADIAVRAGALISAYGNIFRHTDREGLDDLNNVLARADTRIRKSGEQSIHGILTQKTGMDTEGIAREALRAARATMLDVITTVGDNLDAKISASDDALRAAEEKLQERKYSDVFELSNRVKALAIEREILKKEMATKR